MKSPNQWIVRSTAGVLLVCASLVRCQGNMVMVMADVCVDTGAYIMMASGCVPEQPARCAQCAVQERAEAEGQLYRILWPLPVMDSYPTSFWVNILATASGLDQAHTCSASTVLPSERLLLYVLLPLCQHDNQQMMLTHGSPSVAPAGLQTSSALSCSTGWACC